MSISSVSSAAAASRYQSAYARVVNPAAVMDRTGGATGDVVGVLGQSGRGAASGNFSRDGAKPVNTSAMSGLAKIAQLAGQGSASTAVGEILLSAEG